MHSCSLHMVWQPRSSAAPLLRRRYTRLIGFVENYALSKLYKKQLLTWHDLEEGTRRYSWALGFTGEYQNGFLLSTFHPTEERHHYLYLLCEIYDWIILYYRMIYNTTSHIIIHHLSLSLLISLFINSSPTRSLSLTLSLTFFLF